MIRAVVLAAVLSATSAGCAPDPPDTYSTPGQDAPPATRAPLTATTVPTGADATGVETEPVDTFAPNGEVIDVRSLDNSFIQQDIEIIAGTKVNWINGGRNDHNVLPVDEAQNWGVDRDTFVPGTEYAHVFDTPGVYPYYCSIHGTTEVGMIGSVVVTEPA